jgi:hypothetical protein
MPPNRETTRELALRAAVDTFLRSDRLPATNEKLRAVLNRAAAFVDGCDEYTSAEAAPPDLFAELVIGLVQRELDGPKGLPACAQCGAYMTDAELHLRWHREFEQSPLA